MKLFCAIALGGVLSATSALSAPPPAAEEALARKAESCVKERAPEVARYAKSMTEAVDFLVDDLCAVSIGHYRAYRQSAAWLQTMTANSSALVDQDDSQPTGHDAVRKMRENFAKLQAQWQATTIDADTGEMVQPAGANQGNMFAIGISEQFGGGKDGRFRSVAAAAVLEAKAAQPPPHP